MEGAAPAIHKLLGTPGTVLVLPWEGTLLSHQDMEHPWTTVPQIQVQHLESKVQNTKTSDKHEPNTDQIMLFEVVSNDPEVSHEINEQGCHQITSRGTNMNFQAYCK